MTSCDQSAPGKPLLRRLTRIELENTLSDVFPQVAGQWTSTLPADSVSTLGFDNDQSNTIGNQAASAIFDTAQSVATAVVGAPLAQILPCSSSSPDRTCAEQFINQYGRRLFRRPLTQAEHDRYLAFFDSSIKKGADFKTTLKWIAVGLIQSPSTLYRSEIGEVASGMRNLTPYEIATELAYTYTGTTPTDDLLTQADSGNLGDPVALAKSLLATPNGKNVIERFFSSWLDYERVASIQKTNVPNFSTVSQDMVQETRAFIDSVLIQKGGGLRELLTSNTTNPSTALASFYGFPAPAGDYATISRPDGRGIGILAQGSFLSTRAQPDGSSPTQRGVFVFSRLLCQNKPSVPKGVPPISAAAPGQRTTRQRYEIDHLADAEGGAATVCASCHKLFDPIGFGFEHFDEVGRYRQDESGLPIDSAADVPNPDGSALFQFSGEEDLMTGLAQQPEVYQCFAGYLAAYAYATTEPCLDATQVKAFSAGNMGITDYLAELASEPHFGQRSAQ